MKYPNNLFERNIFGVIAFEADFMEDIGNKIKWAIRKNNYRYLNKLIKSAKKQNNREQSVHFDMFEDTDDYISAKIFFYFCMLYIDRGITKNKNNLSFMKYAYNQLFKDMLKKIDFKFYKPLNRFTYLIILLMLSLDDNLDAELSKLTIYIANTIEAEMKEYEHLYCDSVLGINEYLCVIKELNNAFYDKYLTLPYFQEITEYASNLQWR